MTERVKVGSLLFIPDLMAHVLKNLRQNVTVTPCSYDRQHDVGLLLEFDVRVTKIGELAVPPTHRPTTKKQFTDRLVTHNARRLQRKGNQR